MSIGGIFDIIAMLGLIWDPAQFQEDGGYGHMKPVTVAGKTLPWWLAAHWAAINEVSGRALAAGGGVFSVPLTWDSGTGAADPGAGRLRAGGADLTAATALHVSETDADGVGIGPLLAQMVASASMTKSQARLGHRSDRTRWVLLNVTAATDSGVWRTLAVTTIASSSASPFADGDPLTLSFVRVGDPGSGAPEATETVAGIAEIATPAEFEARTDAGRFVVPAHLATGVELYGSSLTAAATLILPAAGTDFDVSGATTIYAISSRARGRQITLTFVDGLTLGHSATLKMPDGIDMTVEAGGSLTLRALSVGWEVIAQKVRRASTSAHGLVRLATQAVLDARTNTTDAVTAALLAHGLGLTGTSVTAGGTLTLPAVGDDFPVSGSGATITAISARTPAGRFLRTTFAGANTLVHSAALSSFTGSNITTEAGDIAEWKSTAAGWAMIGYQRASGKPLVEPGESLLTVLTASNSPTIQITSAILNGTYDEYIFKFYHMVPVSESSFVARIQRDGSNWAADSYHYHFASTNPGADAASISRSSSDGSIPLGAVGNDASVGESISGTIIIPTPTNSTRRKFLTINTEYYQSDATPWQRRGWALYGSTVPITGLQVFFGVGNIASGEVKVYGKRRV